MYNDLLHQVMCIFCDRLKSALACRTVQIKGRYCKKALLLLKPLQNKKDQKNGVPEKKAVLL